MTIFWQNIPNIMLFWISPPSTLLDSNLFHNALIAVFLAMATMLIPIAVYLHDPKNTGESQDFSWDKSVILKIVVNARATFAAFGIIAITILFWSADCTWLRVILFGLFAAASVVIVRCLCRCYFWLIDDSKERAGKYYREKYEASYRNQCRNKFLKTNKDIGIWLFALEQSTPSIWAEQLLLKNFANVMNNAIRKINSKKDWMFILSCLQVFVLNMEKRRIDALFSPSSDKNQKNFFYCVLEWWNNSFDESEKRVQSTNSNSVFQNEENSSWIRATEVKQCLSDLLEQIITRVLLLNNHSYCWSLLHQLKNYSNTVTHVSELFDAVICQAFFKSLDKMDSKILYGVWMDDSYFPPSWKTTLISGGNPETAINWNWFNAFMKWFHEKMQNKSKNTGYDTALNYTLQGLFPEVDPYLWYRFLLIENATRSFTSPTKAAIELQQEIDRACPICPDLRKKHFPVCGKLALASVVQ